MWKKKDQKLEFSIEDLEYIYQYMILKYDEVKFYKNVYFMLIKTKDDFFQFINVLDKNYLKNSSLIYITSETQHNKSIFSEEVNDFLNIEITPELLEYLKVKISNGKLFQKIDDQYQGLFISKGVIFSVFVLVLYVIINILGSQFAKIKAESGGGLKISMDSVFFFYENVNIITLFFLAVVSSLMIMKYIKHLPFMELSFSKYYVLLKYKEKLYSMLLKYYIQKKGKIGEIGYINAKVEFLNIYHEIFPYLSSNEISDILFFSENDSVEISLKNALLKQDLVLDYQNFKYIQNNNVKEKIKFFQTTKEKNQNYQELLKLNYENEIEKLKGYMNMKGLYLYLFITLTVVFMIGPVLLSAL